MSGATASAASTPVQQRLAALDATVALSIPPKAPNTEIYGFVMYLASIITFGVYLFWAYVPDDVLHRLGIYYYPSKWWAIAMPMYTLVCFGYLLCLFVAYTLIYSASLDSAHAITDEHANVIENLGTQVFKNEDRVPELMDVPISVVNQCVFGTMDSADDDHNFRLDHRKRPWPSQPNLVALEGRVGWPQTSMD